MRFACAIVLLFPALIACSSASDRTGLSGQRSVFHNPYGYSPFIVTNASTRHPPYMICNGSRCFYIDENGNFTRMSDDERRDWRARMRMAEQNRRFNEGENFPPPDSPENRKPDRDADAQSAPEPTEVREFVRD